MASRANRFFSDPSLGQGFANLAELFKPPSATDTYAYARAKAAQEEAARLKDLYDYAQNPNMDRQQFDQRGIAAGRFNPSQSYYSVDQNNATSIKKTGMEQTGANQRNSEDNRTKIVTTSMAPMAQDTVRYTPPDIAAGLKIAPQQFGVQTVKPNEINRLPGPQGQALGGPTVEGKQTPLSLEQQKGAVFSTLSPEMQRAILGSGITLQQITDPATGKPQFQPNVEAIGKTPAPPVPTGQPKTAMAKFPDGRQTSVMLDPTQGWLDSQTRQPIPQGSTVFDIKAQDTMQGVTNPTTANQTAANNRAAELVRMRGTVGIYKNLLANNPGAIGLPGLIRGTAQNAIQVAQDMARSFGTDVPSLMEGANSIKAGLQKVAPDLFDPSIPEAAFLQGTLAYGIARTENPSGEVSRQAYERALERIRGGMLSNTAASQAAIGALEKVLQQEEAAIGALRNPGGVTTPGSPAAPSATPGAAVRWGRDANGNPVRIQGP
jgi:hypothetical protein